MQELLKIFFFNFFLYECQRQVCPMLMKVGIDLPACHAGGVFEEAMAQAALFLEPGCRIAQTVRSQSGVVDAAWVAGDLSSQVFPPSLAPACCMCLYTLTEILRVFRRCCLGS